MTDYTGQIRAKRLGNTGITEDHVQEMFANKGGYHMAVVELRVDEVHDKVDGKRKVDLIIDNVELAPNDDTVAHLRNLQRSFHYERKLHSEGETLDIDGADDLEPKVADVLAEGAKHTPHEFVDTPDGDCDVCGQTGGAPVHQDIEEPALT